MTMNRRHTSFLLATTSLFFAFIGASQADNFPSGSPSFASSYANVLKSAKSDKKPGIIVFSASWCGPCQKNKKDVYPDSAVKAYHDKFSWAYLDTDEAQNAKAAEKYGVSGIPHIEFVDANGKSIGQMIGQTTPAEFTKKLDEVLAAHKAATTSAAGGGAALDAAMKKEMEKRAEKKAPEAAAAKQKSK